MLSFVAATAALGCEITSDGSTGDPPTEPTPGELGDGARLRDIIKPAEWFDPGNQESVDCAIPLDQHVEVTGQVIVAIDRFDETSEGAVGNIYIQDLYGDDEEPLPFSGVTVFDPAFTPPDLRLFEGDVVDTVGNFMEFPGPTSGPFNFCASLPEIGGTMTFRFDHGPAQPITVVNENGGPTRFSNVLGYENARQWLGMLVRIEGVAISGPPDKDPSGRYTATINMGSVAFEDSIAISNELFDLENEGPELADGTTFSAVTGVITFFYGFKLAPRSIDDFEM
ncbi:MAG: hypothetical protein IPM79_21540 [Polyangiaceae bacterium]|nr:hypothetical protein [Polyangiaceae bacterium]MBK8940129.1 hypothetical protein [Polyangiaceae bacterium]